MKGKEHHPVLYDRKRGIWTCRDPECDYQILPAKLDERFGRPVSIDSGHVMWIYEVKR